MFRILFLFLTFIFIQIKVSAQVVNIEAERIHGQDSIGWAGSANAGLTLIKNSQRFMDVSSDVHLQRKHLKNLSIFLVSTHLIKVDDKAFVNNALVHLRYNRKLNNLIRWEVFTQAQNNKITKVKFRGLAGTGPRFKIMEKKHFSLYAASLYMYEYMEENETNGLVFKNDHRLSSYVTFTLHKDEKFEFISTTYYQPRLDLWNDYRVLNNSDLTFNFTRKIFYTLAFSWIYDSAPVTGIPNVMYEMGNKVGVKF